MPDHRQPLAALSAPAPSRMPSVAESVHISDDDEKTSSPPKHRHSRVIVDSVPNTAPKEVAPAASQNDVRPAEPASSSASCGIQPVSGSRLAHFRYDTYHKEVGSVAQVWRPCAEIICWLPESDFFTAKKGLKKPVWEAMVIDMTQPANSVAAPQPIVQFKQLSTQESQLRMITNALKLSIPSGSEMLSRARDSILQTIRACDGNIIPPPAIDAATAINADRVDAMDLDP